MRTIITLAISIILFQGVFAQENQKISGKSPTKFVRAGKPQVTKSYKAIPDLVIKGEEFIDIDQNNTINGDEICYLKFQIENLGQGKASRVRVRITQQNKSIKGLEFPSEIYVGDIEPGKNRSVSVKIEGKMELTDGTTEFKVEAIEEAGFDAYPLPMNIETRSFQPPQVIVADAAFSTDGGGKLKLNYPINLRMLIQNTGKGKANGIKIDCQFMNPNCILLGETNTFSISELLPGDTSVLDLLFTANRRYNQPEIPISIDITESYGKFSKDTVVRVGLEQDLEAQKKMMIAAIPASDIKIQRASLNSEVDKNIPVNAEKNGKKIALVIGNEDYTKFQKGLSTEANVRYARNDASVFREYLINTVGFEEGNVFLLMDATAAEMSQKFDLVTKLATKTGSDAELLVFYAGHGQPDENTKAPYIMPVDVSGTNLTSGIRLSDMYKQLGQTGARRVTIILDACFSGGGRTAGLLATRSVKIKPPIETLYGNTIVLSATSADQTALPYDQEKHGMFTYFLLKKLQESKGEVTYGELTNYLKEKVSLESLKVNNKEQDPGVNVSEDVVDSWMNWFLK